MFSFEAISAIKTVPDFGPLLTLAIILVLGITGERIAQWLHGPGITGNLTIGILIGPSFLDLFKGKDVVSIFAPITTFAMVFIALAVGSQLSYRRLHNALTRIVFIAFGEAFVASGLVTLVVYLYSRDLWTALLLGALCAATAPTTTLAVVRENRARGPLVKTLMAVVAIDCSLCILLFSFVEGWAAEFFTGEGFVGGHPVLHIGWQILGSALLAGLIAKGMDFVLSYWRLSEFVAMFLAVLLISGLSQYLAVNQLLVGLFLGVYLANFSHDAETYGRAFEPIEMLLFTLFFTLAGVGLHWDQLGKAGLLCALYVLSRGLGKALGAFVGGAVVRCPRRILLNMPLSLVPQAGVAVGLIIVLQSDARVPEHVRELTAVTVLAAVAINEIIGPFFTRAGLRFSKEANSDRPRLMEFLQEEYITTNLVAEDKDDAIKKTVEFFLRTHRVSKHHRETILETVMDRERSMPTALGEGIAIPHGRVESGSAIQGVMAICPEGIDFGAPDGKPVQIIVLIVTPKEHEQRHVEVLASLSGMLSHRKVRARLLAARDAHDAWEVVEDEELRDFNYFLTEVEEEA